MKDWKKEVDLRELSLAGPTIGVREKVVEPTRGSEFRVCGHSGGIVVGTWFCVVRVRYQHDSLIWCHGTRYLHNQLAQR